MRKLCVAVYVLLGALFWLWFSLAIGGYLLYMLVGPEFFWWAWGALGLLSACIAGYMANRLWRCASHRQRSWMLGVGAVALAVLGVGLPAWNLALMLNG